MRVGLNLLPLVPGVGGSWQYVEGLLSALAQHDHDNDYVAFVTNESRPLVPTHARFRAVRVALPASFRLLRIAYENTMFSRLVASHALDCMHHMFGTLPFLGNGPSVVTVFDMMVFDRPQDFSTVKRAYLRRMRARAARRSEQVAPMSHATATALHDILGIEPERMTVIPPALLPVFRPRAAAEVGAFRQRHELPEHFWLFVGGPYPHKNALALLATLERRHCDGSLAWPLVMRGAALPELDAIARRMPSGTVRFLPRLPADDMALLYSAAAALVFPSLYEGGGLPVLEAMACGCPVVASDLPTTREFAGDAAITFDPSSVDAMADAMRRMERSTDERARLGAAGLARASRFHPPHVAASCLEAYRLAVATR